MIIPVCRFIDGGYGRKTLIVLSVVIRPIACTKKRLTILQKLRCNLFTGVSSVWHGKNLEKLKIFSVYFVFKCVPYFNRNEFFKHAYVYM
jgi:hypothetical protein